MVLLDDLEIGYWLLVAYIQICFLCKETKICDSVHFVGSISIIIEQRFWENMMNLKRVKFAKHMGGKGNPRAPITGTMYPSEQIKHWIKFCSTCRAPEIFWLYV